MQTLLFIIGHVVGTLVGAVLIYGALFLKEDEEGRVQNSLEEWWLRIDDLQRDSRSIVSAFIVGAAHLARHLLDRLFGSRIWSVRAVSVAGLLSFSSLECALFFVSLEVPAPHQITTLKEWVWAVGSIWILIFHALFVLTFPAPRWPLLILGLLTLAVAVASAVKPRFSRAPVYTVTIMLLLLVAFAFFPAVYRSEVLKSWVGLPELVTLALLFGIPMNIAFVALIRRTFTPEVNFDSAARVVLLALAQLVAGFALVLVPTFVAYRLMDAAITVAFGIFFSTLTNLYSACIAFLFFFFAGLLLVHRIAWPLISRLLYAAQRLHVFEDRKARLVLCVAGLMVLGVTWSPLERLRQRLLTIIR